MAFHINEKGVAGVCSAQEGNCPFGTADEHYPTREAAQTAYEEAMSAVPELAYKTYNKDAVEELKQSYYQTPSIDPEDYLADPEDFATRAPAEYENFTTEELNDLLDAVDRGEEPIVECYECRGNGEVGTDKIEYETGATIMAVCNACRGEGSVRFTELGGVY